MRPLLTVEFARRPIILEVELAHSQVSQFVSDYSEWVGKNMTWEQISRNGFAIDVGTGKWGAEYRIYFTKDQTLKRQLERYGCRVDDGDVRNDGTFRINSKVLFRELVAQHGLRLGENM